MTDIKKTKRTLWRRIAEDIQGDISANVYQPGEKLPTEHAFAERFGVNRHTVRRAISFMVEKGLLNVEQGSGTFVCEHVVDYVVGTRTRFSEIIAGQDRAPGGALISCTVKKADPHVRKALGLPKNGKILCLRRLGEADGRPVSLGEHMFRMSTSAGLKEAYMRRHSITKALADIGISDYQRKITRVTTRLPSREEAGFLQQSPNRPVVVSESLNVMPDGKPLEYGVTLFPGDRVQLIFEP